MTVKVTEEALEKLVRNYCRESGVRGLEKYIEKIARKIAFNRVQIQEEKEEKNVEKNSEHNEINKTIQENSSSIDIGRIDQEIVFSNEGIVVQPIELNEIQKSELRIAEINEIINNEELREINVVMKDIMEMVITKQNLEEYVGETLK